MGKYRGVENGTPTGAMRLCDFCSYGQVVKSDNSQEIVYCHASGWLPAPIRIRVVECSKYVANTVQSLKEMEDQAWVLETKKGQPIGFVSPAEFRTRHDDEDIVPSKFYR